MTLAGSPWLSSTIQVNNFGLTDSSTPPATIAGNLAITAASPLISVSDSVRPSRDDDDLRISAAVSGTYGGSASGFAGGLREQLSYGNSFDEVTPNTSATVKPVAERGATNVVGATGAAPWSNTTGYETWIYTGQVYDSDGFFSLAGTIDDNLEVFVDGMRAIRQTGTIVTQSASTS